MKIQNILENIDQSELQAFADQVKNRLGLEAFDLRALKNNVIELELIRVPKDSQGQGIGTRAMELLTRYADTHGIRITLQLANKDYRRDWGTTSKERLARFYKQFGFVRNADRYKDFSLSIYANMYRNPKKKN